MKSFRWFLSEMSVQSYWFSPRLFAPLNGCEPSCRLMSMGFGNKEDHNERASSRVGLFE